MSVGGSIENISVNNRLFPVAADSDVTRDLGGYNNEVQPNGDGSARKVMTRVSWRLDGVQLEIDNLRNDSEFLQDVADGQDWVPILITYVDGTSYQGRGTIEGEITSTSQNATGTVNFKGPDKLKQQ